MDKYSFLEYIYKRQCSPGDYIILASLHPKGGWKEYPIKYAGPKKLRLDLRKFFKQFPDKTYNLYFSPLSYNKSKRLRVNANTTKFLSQDIDENYHNEEPRPSIIWESSEGKYQGLWELDRSVSIDDFDKYNVALAKLIDADDCFDAVHVFRIPGTVNHKYKHLPKVSNAKIEDPVKLYRVTKLKKLLNINSNDKSSKKSKEKQSEASSTQTIKERKIYAKYNIPQRVREYLASPTLEEGWDRSSIIWFIENKLNELGMTPSEIITLIKGSVFNKYKGRHDEDKRLKAELMKILDNEMDEEESIEALRFSSYQKVMGNLNTFNGWMVKGIWGRNSHGIVAGMPKTFKSTMVHDFAVSVASGKPFLGKYEVLESGPVVIIQNENADYIIKDRTEKMITSKGLTGDFDNEELRVTWAPDLPLYFVNQEGFSLSNEKKKASLEKLLDQIKPVLVVFDPLYLMFDGDLNKAEDLNPALNWLIQLKNKYKTSIMLLHHYNKGSGKEDAKGGSRMSGSIFLYGWIESAWYLTKEEGDYYAEEGDDEFKPTEAHIQLRREFRMASQFPDLNIAVDMGEIGDPYYRVECSPMTGEPTKKKKEKVQVKDNKKELLGVMVEGARYSRRDLQKLSNMDRHSVRDELDKLFKSGLIKIDGSKIYKV